MKLIRQSFKHYLILVSNCGYLVFSGICFISNWTRPITWQAVVNFDLLYSIF